MVIVQTDPRTAYYREAVKERAELWGARICQQMLRDLERMEEFGATNRYNNSLSAGPYYHINVTDMSSQA